MFNSRRWIKLVLGLALIATAVGQVTAQGGRGFGGGNGRGFRGGRGGGPPGQDGSFAQDRDDFHYLLQRHEQVRRTVTNRQDGVETLTESDNAEIAAKIQEHVESMYGRVDDGRPIHMRDPLFAEVFRHADKIKMEVESTDKGVRVIETSDDPYVARLIQAHAEVVDLFVKNGFEEPHKNHAVPKRDDVAVTPTSVEQPAVANGDKPCAGATCSAAGKCANAEKCPSAVAGCCADKTCKGDACPLSDVCPNAKKSDSAADANADIPCPGATCSAAGKCANAEKCPSAVAGCCADKTCKGDACPLSDVCPNAKNPCAGAACPAAGKCANAEKCPSAGAGCCADKTCKGDACPLSDVCPNAKNPCAGAAGKCANAEKCPSAGVGCCADKACKGDACQLNSTKAAAE